jgi:metal-responsive CopG/Arc/MetJ family transcriptional regulator
MYMATVKTAISLQHSLFEQVENLARDLRVSRNELVSLALEEYMHRHHNQQLLDAINRQLLDAINQVYDDQPDVNNIARTPAQRHHHRRIVEGEW